MKIKVAVLGAKGRMGSESVKAISAANDLDLVASLDLGDSKSSSWSNHRAKLWPRGSLNDAVCSKGCHLF